MYPFTSSPCRQKVVTIVVMMPMIPAMAVLNLKNLMMVLLRMMLISQEWIFPQLLVLILARANQPKD